MKISTKGNLQIINDMDHLKAKELITKKIFSETEKVIEAGEKEMEEIKELKEKLNKLTHNCNDTKDNFVLKFVF